MTTWPKINNDSIYFGENRIFRSKVSFQIQHEVFRIHVREGRLTDISTIMAWYSIINKVSTDHLDNEIMSTNKSSVWKHLTAFENMIRAMEHFGLACLYGIR